MCCIAEGIILKRVSANQVISEDKFADKSGVTFVHILESRDSKMWTTCAIYDAYLMGITYLYGKTSITVHGRTGNLEEIFPSRIPLITIFTRCELYKQVQISNWSPHCARYLQVHCFTCRCTDALSSWHTWPRKKMLNILSKSDQECWRVQQECILYLMWFYLCFQQCKYKRILMMHRYTTGLKTLYQCNYFFFVVINAYMCLAFNRDLLVHCIG